ncbi:MAG: hypothetical protein ABW049_13345 [Spongiibacteraceae bacterium]
MNFLIIALFSTLGLMFAMLLFIEIGWRSGNTQRQRNPEGLPKGIGVAEGAVFGLLGLVIAFAFSGAATRFEARRHLITEEANAIGTAYLRIDLMPAGAQPELRELFRRYTTVRATAYTNVADTATTQARLAEGTALQTAIWHRTIAESRKPETPSPATMLMVPALNEMIDITSTRVMATENHPPPVVYMLLGGLCLIGSLLVGYSMAENKKRNIPHSIAFAMILALATYVIIDLDFPRVGLIRIDAADHMLRDLAATMR